jgi:arginine decarboxylase
MADEWMTPIPKAVFFTKGVGRHKYRPQSLELAMRHAGIEKYNLVQVSGILPSRCKIITVREGLRRLAPGQIVLERGPSRRRMSRTGCYARGSGWRCR